MKLNGKIGKIGGGLAAACLLVVVVCGVMTMGVNDAGYRTVVQYPNGTINVEFEPGIYFKWFGKTTVYPDVATMDFDQQANEEGVLIDQKGIAVRYRDGGTGTIFGKARYSLPVVEEQMVLLHKEARTIKGVGYKILKPTTEEAVNQTAGLMDSEEGYGSKRSIFTQMSKEQINDGLYQTVATTTYVTDEATEKTVAKTVATIKTKDGKDLHFDSYLTKYGISLSTFQLNNPTFEAKTLKQISDKREATMAIITAKANAEKAKQDAITAEEDGKAKVMTAQYEEEVIKKKAEVVAEREAEVALIKAKQGVAVAEQGKLEAEQLKFQAVEYRAQQVLIGEGEAERKRLVMEADGALEQKLSAAVRINKAYADALGMNKLVPDVVMGGGSGDTNQAMSLVDMLMVKTAKDLGLDTQVQ